ncbi:MAG TPA: protease modulator HflC [Gammaproteobacteria bacterium]|nr:protease modulator HflC [Gammaproteobacteria bacterium]
MSKTLTTVIIAGLVALVLVSFSTYTVAQWQKAILFRLGEVVRTDIQPGLHFKLPFVNNVRKFDGRILTLDVEPERFLTSEKKNVIVDSFVKWRISNVKRYYTSVLGDELQARQRIEQVIKDGMRSEFGKRTIHEVVSGERTQIMDILTKNANRAAQKLGIEIVDVRIKRIDLPSAVSSSVYRRMEAERHRVAKEFRSRGAEAAERIRADADRQREVIMAQAYRDAEAIRGQGDAKAADIYAKAYTKNPEFYAFYRSLQAYRKTFNSKNDLLVLQPDSEFFRYFNDAQGKP